MRKLIYNGISAVLVVYMPIVWFSAAALHLLTIITAYQVSGFFASMVSLLFPILSQAYWVYELWDLTGNIVNGYSFYVFVYLAYLAVGVTLFWILIATDPDR